MKSQSTSLPVSSFVHTEVSETTAATVLVSTHGRAWEAVTAPGHLPEALILHRWWGCTAGFLAPHSCLLQLSPSIHMLAALAAVNRSRTKQPRRQRQQWWMATLVPVWPHPPGDPTGKHSGLPEGSNVRLCYLVLPSARIQPVLVDWGHWSQDIQHWVIFLFSAIGSLDFTKPCHCIPCTLLTRVSPSSIYLVGTHISLFCPPAYPLPWQPSALPLNAS